VAYIVFIVKTRRYHQLYKPSTLWLVITYYQWCFEYSSFEYKYEYEYLTYEYEYKYEYFTGEYEYEYLSYEYEYNTHN